ncbi:hypothetical protein HYV71_02665 [Candidatus Uhrbacteria bacterium]|nr:hypothetical protein [Candidatus Uhrbacteria bacterium]
MKKLLFVVIFVSLLSSGFPVSAQEAALQANTDDGIETSSSTIIVPVITSDYVIPLNKPALFEATESTIIPPPAPAPTYRWIFSDTDSRKTSKEVVRTFSRTGKYRVTLTIRQGQVEANHVKEVFVYDKRVLLVTDKDKETGLQEIADQAAESGVLLEAVSVARGETEFLNEEAIVKALAEKSEFIDSADVYIFYTGSLLGLKAFARYWRTIGDPARKERLQQKFYTVITDGSIKTSASIVQQVFQVIQPSYILLSRRESLNPLFTSVRLVSLITTLQNRAIEYRVIDERSEKSKIFLLSHLISRFISQGVPTNTIYLLLAFPFIVFIIAFAREVFGVSAFGVYTPAMIATAFLILGIQFSLITFLVIVVTGFFIRWIVNKIDLLYIPRTGLVLSAVALSFLGVIWVLLASQSSIALSLAVFPMLVMSTVTEKFLSAQQEEGLRNALRGILSTLAVVISAYYVVTWNAFAGILTATPEYVIVPLIGLLLLGRFTGLRLSEYIRFRGILKDRTIEE